ncbi:MAG TPA: sigma-70 family RNA polymerase sigma factor [Urbifossiella sp.]|jgi:RNA polymerase sigma-70 factor (ECF subfamily)|nr:sigma-70 family RNA polymerase sigma factor [Urbifossiella sp.]
MSTESDRLLVQRVRENPKKSRACEEAWNELFSRYRGRLAAYVRRRLKDQAAVDDVVQETFVGLGNSLANFDDRRDLQTWLFTIASHKVTDHLRRVGRRPVQPGGDAEEEGLDRAADGRQRPASSLARSAERRDREEEALGRALTLLVRDWIGRGDYTCVMTLELLLVRGWGNKDVAARVGLTEQQVANLKFQAKRRLHDHLAAAQLSADVFPELRADE